MYAFCSFLKPIKQVAVVFLFCIGLNTNIIAQVDTSFWFAVPEATISHGDRPIVFEIISHDQPITYTITQPANPGFVPITGSVPANSNVTKDISAFIDILENKPPNTTLNNGLHITTSGPATVIYNIKNAPNAEIFVLKGRHALGTKFFALFQSSAYNAPTSPIPAYCSIDIVATENNTSITITPTKAIVGHAANVPFTIVLNKGQTYSATAVGPLISDHLSGTLIVSDKPIAVTVKDDSIKGLYGTCADMVGDQIVPIQNIDNEYIIIKGFLSGNDKAYVMAIENNTDIHINGNPVPIATLNTGQTYTLDISQFSTYVKSGKPFYLMQLTGQGCEYSCPLLPSLTGCCDSKSRIAYIESTTIYAFITTRSGNEGNFLYNGMSGIILPSMFSVVPGTNNEWMAARVSLSPPMLIGTSATISNASGTFILGMFIANGTGSRFGFVTNYSNLHLGPDITKCPTVPFIIDPSPTWNNSLFSTGDTIAPLYVYDSGTYWVRATNYECSLSDTIVIHNLPDHSFQLPNDTSYCGDASYPLSVPSGFVNYLWSNGATGTSIVATQSAKIWVLTHDSNNCPYTDTIDLHINKFKLISKSDTICYGDSVQLFSSAANNWSWYPAVNISDSSFQNPYVSPTTLTTYHLTSYYYGSTSTDPPLTCSDSLSIQVIHHIADIIHDTTVCLQNHLVLTAIAGYPHYLWNSGEITQSKNVVSSGLFWVKASDNYGCSATDSANILLVPTLNLIILPASASICKGDSTTLSVSSAYPNAQYIWNTGETTSTITVKPASTTTYTVTGTFAGCESSVSQTIIVKPLPIVSIIATNDSLCLNDSIHLQGNGAASYLWQPQNVTASNIWVKPSVNSSYSVTGTSINGCKSNASISISVISLPIINASATPSSVCPGDPITLAASGGNSYYWTPYNISAQQITLTTPGTGSATVTGTGFFGCKAQKTVSFVTKPSPVLSINTSNDSICINTSATLNVTSNLPGTQFLWSTNQNTASIVVSPVTSTWYFISGTKNNCTSKDSVLITPMPLPIVTATGNTDTICPGDPVTLNATGAASYLWQPFNLNTQQITVNPTSSVNCIVTGYTNFGCSSTDDFYITVSQKPVVNLTFSDDTICIGTNVSLNMSSSLTGTSFHWSTNETSPSINVSPTSTTTYSCTATYQGCSVAKTKTIVVNPLPGVNIQAPNDSICEGNSIMLTATGASTYQWSPTFTGSLNYVSPNISTTYYVTGTDVHGCTNASSFQLTVVPLPSLNASALPPSVCKGGNIVLSASGAIIYSWSPISQTGPSITITPTISGDVTVVGTGVFGCQSAVNVPYTVKPIPVVGMTAAHDSICKNDPVTLTANSSLVGTQFSWSTSQIGNSITVSPTVNTKYIVTGTLNGCSSKDSLTIIVKPIPITSITASNDTLCVNDSIYLQGNGAVSYLWQPQNIIASSIWVKPSATTNYTVIGTAPNGCKSNSSINLTVIPLPAITASATPDSVCPGEPIVLSASGANSYYWTPYNINSQQVNLPTPGTGSATVTGTGFFGCKAKKTVSFYTRPLPVLAINTSNDSICINSSATLNASSNLPGTQFLWSTSQNTASIVVSPATNTWYKVTGTKNNCSAKDSVLITTMPLPVVTATGTNDTICPGDQVVLSASGASSYSWQPFNLNTQQITVNPTSSVNCIVTGYTNFGCSATDDFYIKVSQKPILNLTFSDDTICIGTAVNLNISSSLTGTTYHWSTGASTLGINVTPTTTTTYSCTGNYQGCETTITKTIVVNPLPVVNIQAANDSICKGSSMILTGTGASTYHWSSPVFNGTQYTVTPNASKTYYITGTDVNGCKGTSSFQLTVVPLPTVVASVSFPSICAGESTVLSASGAISYAWAPFNLTGQPVTITPTASGNAIVTGTGVLGCQSKDTVAFTVKPVPIIGINTTEDSICKNASVTLTANSSLSGTQFSWSNSQSGNSITVSPLINTKYVVTGTLNGCSSKDSLTIFVMPLPPLTANANPTSVCPGGTVTLTANNATAYNWSPGNLSTSIITINPTASITITVTGSTSFGCQATVNVPVTVKPNPIVSLTTTKDTICAGETTTITASSTISGTGYTWTGGGNSNPYTVQPNVSKTYICTGTINGCSGVDSVRITVHPLPVVNMTSANDSICRGDSLMLNVSGASSYVWASPVHTGNQYKVSPATSTTYYVTGTDNNNCKSIDSIYLTVVQLPHVVITSSSNTICKGDSIELTGSGAIIYEWQPSGSSNSQVTISPANTTLFKLTGTDNFGCVNSDTITIFVKPLPHIIVIPLKDTICKGDTVTIIVTSDLNGTVFTWTPGGTNDTITPMPLISTVYMVVGDMDGCSDTAYSNIHVDIPPTISFLPLNPTICSGESIQLNVQSSNATSSFKWNTGQTSSTILVNPAVDSTYVVNTTTGVCENTNSITVVVHEVPTASLIPANPRLCAGDSLTIQVVLIPSNSSILWNNGSTLPVITIKPKESTGYSFLAKNYGCEFDTSFVVSVFPYPTVELGIDRPLCTGQTIYLNAGIDGDLYHWNDGSNEPVLMVEEPGIYWVEVSRNGCLRTDTITLIPCSEIWVPNAFRPNDDGKNDIFRAFTTDVSWLKMSIYDRWGKLLFKTENLGEGWDGKYDGEDLPSGVYIWLIEYEEIKAYTIPFRKVIRGQVTLLR